MPRTRCDIQIENHGSIVLFQPMNKEAKAWINDHVQDDAQWFGRALAVEPRYAADLAQGMVEDGLVVR